MDAIPATDAFGLLPLYIYGNYSVFLPLHSISDGLRKVVYLPIVYGGFADVWEGIYSREEAGHNALGVHNANIRDEVNPAQTPPVRRRIIAAHKTISSCVLALREL